MCYPFIQGETSLHVACRGGWAEIVRLLLKKANEQKSAGPSDVWELLTPQVRQLHEV